jgi:hypothetical protein
MDSTCSSTNSYEYERQVCKSSAWTVVANSFCSGTPGKRTTTTYCCPTTDSTKRASVASAYKTTGADFIDKTWFQYWCSVSYTWNQLSCAIRNAIIPDPWSTTIVSIARNQCNTVCKPAGFTCPNY